LTAQGRAIHIVKLSSVKIPLDSPEIDWLLFLALFPAVLGTVVVFGAGILLGLYWSFWLALTLIGILALPLCAAVLGGLGIGLVAIVRLWWALIRPPKKRSRIDYYIVAFCSFFACLTVAVFWLHNPLLEDSWKSVDFDGKAFFRMSVGLVTITGYPLVALIVALRVRLRPPPTAPGQRGISAYVIAGASIVAFWVISAAGVIYFQEQIGPLVKSMRVAAAPWSDPRYQHYADRGAIADSICRGDLESAGKALRRDAVPVTQASVFAVMECLTATRWTNGGRTTETVFMAERVPLILEVILRSERALGINSVNGCTPMQVSLQKELMQLHQLPSLRFFVDRHLSLNCNDSSGKPVFWSGGLRSVADLKRLRSMGVDLYARDSTGQQVLTANPDHFIDTVDGDVLWYLVDQGVELEDPRHLALPFNVELMLRIEGQGRGALPIAPQMAAKLVARVGEPTTQALVASVQKYEPRGRRFDVLVTSYRARVTGQEKAPHFAFEPTTAQENARITVWIGSDGDVVERESRVGKTEAWYRWRAPAAVIEVLQMMMHDPVFGEFHSARTTDTDHFNAAACMRLSGLNRDSGYLSDRQARMLTFVLDAARNDSSMQALEGKPAGLDSCTVEALKSPT
jgi:hypothetical protein